MADRDSMGAPAPTPGDAPRSQLHAAGIESRLHRYPGCNGLVLRYFILHDDAPQPFRTAAEALEALRHRQAERRQS